MPDHKQLGEKGTKMPTKGVPQRLLGAALAAKRTGKAISPEVKKVAEGMAEPKLIEMA
jgi:hypothetical protein